MVTLIRKSAHPHEHLPTRTEPARRSRRSVLAMLSTASVLALAGGVLLGQGNSGGNEAPAQPSTRSSPQKSAPASAGSPAVPRRSTGPTLRAHGPRREAAPTGHEVLPPPGDGPAGNTAVQRALDRSSPPDLSRQAERRLVQLGSAVWTAEVTGRGRQRWPDYFTGTEVRPYRHFRIQAAIARRAAGGRVVVQLVWAGASPSGTDDIDNRTAQVFLTRNGGSRWTPSR
ncbi:hypothetical protein JK364_49445 [Streptomyces sp. 110]|uniref:Serine/threonine protein kinase n=1 Tax=Streptomyces endocoffeicus TaxID=2898945 RepID=A0ABS1Q7K9_9ACTN|nr:hypothetical protein [Streptomyces endocoffeicus]MBL1120265.1 hypothetical protein [Streptomyces endocoffeicus]